MGAFDCGNKPKWTDDSQAIAWKAVYTPFGEAVASITTVDNPFRFPGQYYDQETGLHYNYFRYYNPQTGRYITPDPIGLWGGINLFSYVQNNPVNFTDSLGLLDIYARGGASQGQWVYEVEFYTNLAATYEREIGRTFISRLDRIRKIVDWVWGERTGVSDLEKFADRWECDKGDKVGKKIFDEMFPNRYTISEEEFRKFMDTFLEAVPGLKEFYNVDQMIQRANKRGRRLPEQ